MGCTTFTVLILQKAFSLEIDGFLIVKDVLLIFESIWEKSPALSELCGGGL